MRTYQELNNYYRPEDFYNENGYTSTTYGETYYDGYGYNFFNGNTGYYEWSRHPPKLSSGGWSVSSFLTTLSGMIVFLSLYTWLYYYLETKESVPIIEKD